MSEWTLYYIWYTSKVTAGSMLNDSQSSKNSNKTNDLQIQAWLVAFAIG